MKILAIFNQRPLQGHLNILHLESTSLVHFLAEVYYKTISQYLNCQTKRNIEAKFFYPALAVCFLENECSRLTFD